MTERLGANGMPMKEREESNEMLSEILEVNPNKSILLKISLLTVLTFLMMYPTQTLSQESMHSWVQ